MSAASFEVGGVTYVTATSPAKRPSSPPSPCRVTVAQATSKGDYAAAIALAARGGK